MSNHTQIQKQIADLNAVRAEIGTAAGQPRIRGLKLARAARVADVTCAVQQARFSNWTNDAGGSYQSPSITTDAAQQDVREEMRMTEPLEELLRSFGYKLVDDAWDTEGRKTYLNSEDADKTLMRDLRKSLAEYGWKKHNTQLRAFRNPDTGEHLEIEVGGPDVSGHFLHHLKSE